MDCAPISTGSPPKPLRPEPAYWRALRLRCRALRWRPPARSRPIAELLPPEQAFRFSARALDDRTLEARFAIADGYYLYRDKIKFARRAGRRGAGRPGTAAGQDARTTSFSARSRPTAATVVVKLPLAGAAAGQSVVLAADSQGCADVGVCYPANRQKVTLALPAAGNGPGRARRSDPAARRAGSSSDLRRLRTGLRHRCEHTHCLDGHDSRQYRPLGRHRGSCAWRRLPAASTSAQRHAARADGRRALLGLAAADADGTRAAPRPMARQGRGRQFLGDLVRAMPGRDARIRQGAGEISAPKVCNLSASPSIRPIKYANSQQRSA